MTKFMYLQFFAEGGRKYYKKCTNANSISVELCDKVKDGKVYPTFRAAA